jgi:hypothetical protein
MARCHVLACVADHAVARARACIVALAAVEVVNSPVESGGAGTNTVFTAFQQRSPKYLIPPAATRWT